MKQVLLRSFATVVIMGLLAGLCMAQTAGTGAISGTITDPSGAAVAGAAISAIDTATGEKRPAVSSGNGTYLVPLLRPGTYRVEVSNSGFKLTVSADVPVHVTETVTVNLQLVVGSPAETVTVIASSELLKTTDSTLGNVVDQRAVDSLPLVTRNYTQILGLSPGVSAETFNAGAIGRGGVDDSMVTAGSSTWDNNFQMNGVEVNDAGGSGHYTGGVATPNPDTIQEFKVQTSQYDASFGRNAGANVNVLTKGGSNKWHGNVWEYFRNEVLNANMFFMNQTGQPRPVLRQNQFGGTLGGPILKDKLLVFGSYQGTRQRNGIDINCSSSVILPVLTDDRSAAGLAAAVGPATAFGGADFLGRPVTAETVGAQGQALFNLKLANGQYVVPNPQTTKPGPNGLPEGFSTFSTACPYTEDQFMTNMDWLQNSKSSFQGRFFFANSEATFALPQSQFVGSTVPGAPLRNPQNFRNFSLSHTYAFTSQLVNQAEFGFHHTYAGTEQSFPFTWSDIGSTVPSFDEAMPVIQTLGGFNVGGNGQTVINLLNTYVFQDTLTWIRGRHSIRFGGGLTRARQSLSNFSFPSIAVFYDYPSLLLGTALVPGGPSFTPFITADLAGITSRDWGVWNGSLYAQDDIKVTPRLTVNLGLRYDHLGGFGESNGRNSSIDPALLNPNPPADGSLDGVVVSDNFPGARPAGVVSSGNDQGIYGEGQNSINPRVGFAWSLPGTDRLVLRGGYGIYRQRTTGQPNLQQISAPPFGLIRLVMPNTTGADFANPMPPDPGEFPQFIPYSPSTAASPYVTDVHFTTPTFQRYSLNLQAEIARDFVLEVGYAGMRGTHMMVVRDINQASLASATNPIRGESTNTLSNIQLRVPYQGFSASSFNQIQSTGFAWYNALQASLRKRFSHGLQFLASYTFARDLANVEGSTTGSQGGMTYGDQNNPRSGYGPDSFIRPHRFVFSGVYDLPGPTNRHSLAGQVLGNWKLAGVVTIQSGRRRPILNQSATNVHGVATDFGQIVPGCNIATSGSVTERLDNWINKDCLAPYPVVGDDGVATGFGNSPMGILHGPGQANTDLSLIKLFPLEWPSEGAGVEFRTEFFNAFNQTTFADPDLYISNGPIFGTITSTVGNPRIIQFALKLNF